MKARNLQILKENGFLVPPFVIVNDEEDLTPVQKFLLDDEKTYAVRSSFSMEDGTHSSFAGQFKTLLHVKKNDLSKAIREIKNGFSVDNVQKYAENNGLKVNKNDGRVIIQEMVDAEIQIRTVAMDFWASLDHKIQYKFPNDIPDEIKQELESKSWYYNTIIRWHLTFEDGFCTIDHYGLNDDFTKYSTTPLLPSGIVTQS